MIWLFVFAGMIIAGALSLTVETYYAMCVRGGKSGISAGTVLYVYGYFYTESPMNNFLVQQSDLMISGIVVAVAGILTLVGGVYIGATIDRPRKQPSPKPAARHFAPQGSWR